MARQAQRLIRRPRNNPEDGSRDGFGAPLMASAEIAVKTASGQFVHAPDDARDSPMG